MPKSGLGGRRGEYLTLLHPGPSAICTAVTVTAGWSVHNRLPSGGPPPPGWKARLAWAGAAMALAQVSTGVVNDAYDAPWDRQFQPYKPIAQGSVPRAHAWVIGGVSGAASMLLAARAGPSALRLMALGLGSGWAYSLGLSRTPFSFVPFATGLATVPLLGPAAVGASLPAQAQVTVLAAALGVGLHLANGGPDIARDRLSGRRSLPVLLGEEGSRALSQLVLGLGSVAVALGSPARGRRWAWAGAAGCAALVLWDRVLPPPDRSQGGHPFVRPALAGGILAVGWLAARAGGEQARRRSVA
ncbi:MAG: UbiA family prenyltransferase [Candidatus Dormibacteria bacterium]